VPSRLTEQELYDLEPHVLWRAPVRMVSESGRVRWGCRICFRLCPDDAPRYAIPESVEEHINEVHPGVP
jgi:hypothetical protein